MSSTPKTAHEDLHSEQGAIRGDRAARARNPVVKVEDLAWLQVEKRDLDAAENFAHDFGLVTAYRDVTQVHLRGALPGSPRLIVGKGAASRFASVAFRAGSRTDLDRLAKAHGVLVRRLDGPTGGAVVDLRDPPARRCA